MAITVAIISLGGSNASKIEFEAIFTPPYNAALYGIKLTHSPHQADVVILAGSGTPKSLESALVLIESLAKNTRLLALGSDTASAAPFARLYSKVNFDLPPSYLLGSPPDPQAILAAILKISQQKI